MIRFWKEEKNMEREIDMSEVSDGKLYGINDMVKAGCNDCKGCFACCQGMGNSIVLDPYDVYRLTTGLNCKFEDLLIDKLDLNVVEGIILPNLKMAGTNESCAFLNDEGRCSIHGIRPGICRIFPLGRIYENGSFQYFLQVNECAYSNRTKVKVKKWIDTPDTAKNAAFIIGPEGGFDIAETEKIRAAGIKTVTLGRRILRTETAGEAVLSMLMYEIGDINRISEK